MNIVIRRSPVAAQVVENEESLAAAIDVGDVHSLLYRRGEIDLADMLAAHLGPHDALDAASLLKEVVRRGAKGSLFRDYRTAVSRSDAERIGLVAMWYERAGRAGCRVWADLREKVAAPNPPVVRRHADGVDADERTARRADSPATSEGAGIMPAWLDAPETSIWRA